MKTKRIISLMLSAIVTIASLQMNAVLAADTDYSNTNYEYAASALVGLGIIDKFEDGTFRPDEKISRAEAASYIMRLYGLKDEAIDKNTVFPYSDVNRDTPYASYILNASTYGIISGHDDGTFDPDG